MIVKMLIRPCAATIQLNAATRFLSAKWYPGIFQLAGLVTFALILYFSFTGNPHGELNFATVLTWRLWWALLPLSLFLIGKFWCAMCPLATLGDLAQKISRLKRVAPKHLRAYGAWVMLALFVALSWAHAVFDIHNTPWMTGVVFVALALGAIGLALRYEHRAFCRFVCPVGLMSGLYAMLSPLALRANGNTCRTGCANQSCRAAPNCKLSEYPRTMDSNRYCVMCGDCVSVSKDKMTAASNAAIKSGIGMPLSENARGCPHDSPKMILRVPTREIAEIRKPVLGEAVFATLLLGLVFVEIFRMTPLYPAFMQRALAFTQIDNYAVVYSLALAGLLLLLGSIAIFISRATSSNWKLNLAHFSYGFLPLAFAAHLGTNLFELSAEGTRSIQVVINNLNLPLALFDLPAKVRGAIYDTDPMLMLAQYALIALGLIATLVAIKRIARRTQTRALPYAAFATAAALIYIAAYSLPMKPGC